ncbi:MAG TPA: glycosyl hydrolase, partial [Clostridia bacterium]|nr:glycosyl hydrolase [Clostridia bacterium]
PKKDRKAFRRVIADSYEMGSQNWTDGFRGIFKNRYGYDPQTWLPVLTGRVVESAEQSDRFLWDLRRLVADQVAYGYVGGLREACHREGLKLWLENYGHWGFPAEFLQYGGQSDEVSGEFWATGDLGSIELRAAASAAHTYGKPIVSAEAFTSVAKFESTPWSLKKRGDWALTEGINHWVLHVYIHQPWEDRLPGVNAWFSTEFNRHNTWFEQSREWIDYYRRCDFLLQQGKHVADVAYFIGEDAPKMTGVRDPELPAGYNYDYINAEVIEKRLKVKNRRFVLPDGMSYSLLVLPRMETMRPELLQKIRDLVAGGGSILGEPPLRSPSLEGYPSCDQRVRRLAEELWGDAVARGGTGVRPFKKGLVFRGADLQPVFQALRIGPDVSGIDPKTILWTHRSAPEAEIYFLSNQSEQPASITPVFRVQGRVPELWDAVSAGNRQVPVFQTTLTGTRVALKLEPRGSMFVVFRGKLANQPVITEILQKDKVFLSAMQAGELPASKGSKSAGSFTMAMWVKPAGKIGLPPEADSGVQLQQLRNEAVVPPHGESLFPGGSQAGAGISVGQNGVVVYEHSGNYFAPLLTAALELKDWAHLAVVYSNNRPALLMNGKLVRQGLQSRYKVHSGLAVAPSGNSGFKGELAAVQDFSQALPTAQIAELARSRPVLDAGSPLAEVALFPVAEKGLEAEVSSTQPFTFLWSNGEHSRVQLFDLPAPKELSGPWQVRFPTCRDVPEQITIDKLAPLNEHENPAVKHFSGTVTYAREFEIDADRLVPERRLWLDLGTVEAIAEVIVNGRNLGIFWKPPFVIDISSAARAGHNSVEVRVTGTWRNRLIGQARYPGGFASANSAAQFQPYLAVDIKVSPNETLAPFGLIGPVRLQSSQRVPLRR